MMYNGTMKRIKNNKNRLKISLILVIIWMITVFCFSNQPGNTSGKTSSGVTTKVVETITKNKGKTENEKAEMIAKIDPIIRKIAHYSIYTLGGIIIMNYIKTYKLKEEREMLISIIIGTVYATTDEIHQYFVPGRSAMITDVGIDALGVMTGVCIFLCILKAMEKLIIKEKNKEINEKYS